MTSTTATHSDVLRLLSYVFTIAQSDIGNTEYLIISWLQKLVCLIFKSLLNFLTFVNIEGPYFAE